MHASEQMLNRMTSMPGGESINKIIAFTQKLENSVSMEASPRAAAGADRAHAGMARLRQQL